MIVARDRLNADLQPYNLTTDIMTARKPTPVIFVMFLISLFVSRVELIKYFLQTL